MRPNTPGSWLKQRLSVCVCITISTVADFEVYPFAFETDPDLPVCRVARFGRISGKEQRKQHAVVPNGRTPLDCFARLGRSHTVDGYLKLEGKPESVWRAGDQGCLEPERHPVPFDADGLVPICVDTLLTSPDFRQSRGDGCYGARPRKATRARVASDAACWLFWSPQGQHSPFVCCEPWHGLCDHQHFEGQLSERPFMNHAECGETWTGGYTVELF